MVGQNDLVVRLVVHDAVEQSTCDSASASGYFCGPAVLGNIGRRQIEPIERKGRIVFKAALHRFKTDARGFLESNTIGPLK